MPNLKGSSGTNSTTSIMSTSSTASLSPPTVRTKLPDVPTLPSNSCSINNPETNLNAVDDATTSKEILNPEYLTLQLPIEELLKRLKQVSNYLKNLSEQEPLPVTFNLSELRAMAMHLTKVNFLRHPNPLVCTLVACSIADILSIFAPNPPYQSHHNIKQIFQFFTQQLAVFQDISQSVYYGDNCYLLEKLQTCQAYSLCFQLDDSTCLELLLELFNTIFAITR